MANAFFIMHQGQQMGPYTSAQLTEAGLTAETMVWAEGMAEWKPAGRVPSLASAIVKQATPEPEPAWPQDSQSYEAAPTDSAGTSATVNYQSAQSRGRVTPNYPGILSGAYVLRIFGVVAIAMGALALAGLLYTVLRNSSELSAGGMMVIGPMFIACLTAIAYGILFIFTASLGLAVRDIARNSFK